MAVPQPDVAQIFNYDLQNDFRNFKKVDLFVLQGMGNNWRFNKKFSINLESVARALTPHSQHNIFVFPQKRLAETPGLKRSKA